MNKECVNRLLAEEMRYDKDILLSESLSLRSKLNNDERAIYNEIIQAVNNQAGGVYFVSGHGGTGKTFLWNIIIKTLRSEGRIVLAVASLLLSGGQTGHVKVLIERQERFQLQLYVVVYKDVCNVLRMPGEHQVKGIIHTL